MISNLASFNADLEDFSKREIPAAARRFVLAIVFEVINRVILRTPVETGRLRGAWIMSIGSDPSTAPTTITTGRDVIAAARSVAQSAATPYSLYVFGNNVVYAEVVDQGGFVPANPENSPKANARRAAQRSSNAKRRARAIDAAARGIGRRGADAGVPLVSGGYSLQAPRGMVTISLEEVAGIFGGTVHYD